MTLQQQLGKRAEAMACDYLCRQGLRLVMRNYLCRLGEIDLVMRDKANLVFVEVRYRKPSRYGSAAATVNWSKQRKLVNAANRYIQQYRVALPCRFDVVAVTPGVDNTLQMEWIRDAFQTT